MHGPGVSLCVERRWEEGETYINGVLFERGPMSCVSVHSPVNLGLCYAFSWVFANTSGFVLLGAVGVTVDQKPRRDSGKLSGLNLG